LAALLQLLWRAMRSPGRAGQPSAVRTVALRLVPMAVAAVVAARAASSAQGQAATPTRVPARVHAAGIPVQAAHLQRPAPAIHSSAMAAYPGNCHAMRGRFFFTGHAPVSHIAKGCRLWTTPSLHRTPIRFN